MASFREKSTGWEARVHRRGLATMAKTFPTKQAAKEWATAIEAKADRREKVSLKAEKTLISELLAEYLAENHKPPPEGEEPGPEHREIPNGERLRISQINADIGNVSVANLTRSAIMKYIQALLETKIPPPANRKKIHPLFNGAERDKKTYKPSSVRKLYYTLKKCLEWHSLTHGYGLDPNLFKKVGVPPGWEQERERRLEPGEEERIFEATDRGYTNRQEWKCLLTLALETGMRSQEMLKARWQDLSLEGRTLNIPKEHVKTRTFRQIPLSKKAAEALRTMERFRKEGEPRIFWQWNMTAILGAAFKRLTKRAKVDDFHIHDLRHEATSRMFEKGKLSDIEIMKITGHTQISTLVRYLKFRTSNLADKMD